MRIQKQRRMDGWRKCPQWIPVRKSTRQREWVFYLYEDGVAWNHLYLGVCSLNFPPFFKHEYINKAKQLCPVWPTQTTLGNELGKCRPRMGDGSSSNRIIYDKTKELSSNCALRIIVNFPSQDTTSDSILQSLCKSFTTNERQKKEQRNKQAHTWHQRKMITSKKTKQNTSKITWTWADLPEYAKQSRRTESYFYERRNCCRATVRARKVYNNFTPRL